MALQITSIFSVFRRCADYCNVEPQRGADSLGLDPRYYQRRTSRGGSGTSASWLWLIVRIFTLGAHDFHNLQILTDGFKGLDLGAFNPSSRQERLYAPPTCQSQPPLSPFGDDRTYRLPRLRTGLAVNTALAKRNVDIIVNHIKGDPTGISPTVSFSSIALGILAWVSESSVARGTHRSAHPILSGRPRCDF